MKSKLNIFLSFLKSALYDLQNYNAFKSQIFNIKSLKNKYRNNRCFIIANGPSIAEEDLTKLKNEFTFVSNHFIQNPSFLDINPNFYFASDSKFFLPYLDKKWESLFKKVPDTLELFFTYRGQKLVQKSNIFSKFRKYFLRYHPKPIWEIGRINLNLEEELFTGDTVIIDFCIPAAIYMGFTEIYLLGVDCNYSFNEDGSVKYGFKTSEITTGRSSNAYLKGQWVLNVKKSYEIINNTIQGIEIYDLSTKGKLNIFPKKNLTQVLSNIENEA